MAKEKEAPEKVILPVTKEEKLKAVQLAGKKLDKEFQSKGTFQTLGAKVGQILPSFRTGFPSLDWHVFGCGGTPKGRIIEMYGLESSGKTALSCHIIGSVQRQGGVAAFIDAEHALDPTFAARLGVNVDELIISQPDCGEDALTTAVELVNAGAVDIIVIDSVAALVPRAELEGDMGDSHMGLQARLMSQAMRKLVGIVSKRNVTVIFINQIRQKLGMVFGDPNTTTGGFGLKFASSLRLEITKVSKTDKGPIMEGDVQIGHKMKVKAQKNKCGPPFRDTILALYYDNGFDTADDVIAHAIKIGVLQGAIKFQIGGKGEKLTREECLDRLEEIKAGIEIYYKELAEQTKLDLGGLEYEESESEE